MDDLFSKPATVWTFLVAAISGSGYVGRYLITNAKARDDFIMNTLLKLMESTNKGVNETQKVVGEVRRDMIGLEESIESTQTANLLILSKLSDQVGSMEARRMIRNTPETKEEYRDEWKETNIQLARYNEATDKVISVIDKIGEERRQAIRLKKEQLS